MCWSESLSCSLLTWLLLSFVDYWIVLLGNPNLSTLEVDVKDYCDLSIPFDKQIFVDNTSVLEKIVEKTKKFIEKTLPSELRTLLTSSSSSSSPSAASSDWINPYLLPPSTTPTAPLPPSSPYALPPSLSPSSSVPPFPRIGDEDLHPFPQLLNPYGSPYGPSFGRPSYGNLVGPNHPVFWPNGDDTRGRGGPAPPPPGTLSLSLSFSSFFLSLMQIAFIFGRCPIWSLRSLSPPQAARCSPPSSLSSIRWTRRWPPSSPWILRPYVYLNARFWVRNVCLQMSENGRMDVKIVFVRYEVIVANWLSWCLDGINHFMFILLLGSSSER
jgi:hypothetical protein